MFLEKIHIIIALMAALIVTITSFLAEDSLYIYSVRLVIAVIVFYILGSIVRIYLEKKIFVDKNDGAASTDPDQSSAAHLDEED